MSDQFHAIKLQDVADVSHLLTPEQVQEPVTLHSNAVTMMTDFEQSTPFTIAETAAVDEALEWMKNQHVRLLFALNGAGEFSGVITAQDLMGRQVMSYMQAYNLSRDEVQVKHIMLPKSDIKGLPLSHLQQAKVGDLVQTLKGIGGRHVLVVDEGLAQVKRIRGIISASDISRQLKIAFDVVPEAKSFAEIERIVTHGGGI